MFVFIAEEPDPCLSSEHIECHASLDDRRYSLKGALGESEHTTFLLVRPKSRVIAFVAC